MEVDVQASAYSNHFGERWRVVDKWTDVAGQNKHFQYAQAATDHVSAARPQATVTAVGHSLDHWRRIQRAHTANHV
jgi:hypothetical protein